jgi:hypothetical protein
MQGLVESGQNKIVTPDLHILLVSLQLLEAYKLLAFSFHSGREL